MAVLAASTVAVKAEADTNTDGNTWGHPITISLSGSPDFLSGEWAKNNERTPTLSAMREFDLNGQGPKMWEWVGPTEGILVWNIDGNTNLQPSASTVFGFNTWGKTWTNGLAALMSLDETKDGKLADAELANLWLWVDANSNAKVDVGELKPLSAHGITQLSLASQLDGEGEMLVAQGASGEGKSFPILEWWSLGGMTKQEFEQYVATVLTSKCIYQWKADTTNSGNSNEQNSGLVRYMIAKEGTLMGVSLPFAQADLEEITGIVVPYSPQEDGTFYSRADMGTTWLDNYMSMGEDGTLYGKTESISKEDPKVKEGEMAWRATHIQGRNLQQLLDAATVKLRSE